MTVNKELLSLTHAHVRRQMLTYKIKCVYVCPGKSPVEMGEAAAVKLFVNHLIHQRISVRHHVIETVRAVGCQSLRLMINEYDLLFV